jgi:hypothetical protein
MLADDVVARIVPAFEEEATGAKRSASVGAAEGQTCTGIFAKLVGNFSGN